MHTEAQEAEKFEILDLAKWEGGVGELAPRYSTASPFPHIVLDEFLDRRAVPCGHRGVPPVGGWGVDLLPPRQRAQVQSDRSVDVGADAAVDPRASSTRRGSSEFLERAHRDRGAVSRPEPRRRGAAPVDHGGYLNMHADFTVHPQHRDWRRRVNLLLYLNEDWRPEYGGDLELWDTEMTHREVSVAPLANRVVVFTTDADSFHGHPEPMQCPPGTARRSLALYYFTHEVDPMVRSTEYRARPGDGRSFAAHLCGQAGAAALRPGEAPAGHLGQGRRAPCWPGSSGSVAGSPGPSRTGGICRRRQRPGSRSAGDGVDRTSAMTDAATEVTPARWRTIGDGFSGRHNSLNFLRLVLATLVVYDHAVGLGGFGQIWTINDNSIGTLAVYGFFGISGFLIAGSAVRNGPWRYLWQRFLRIFPGFWVCLILTALVFGVLNVLTDPLPHCGLSCYFSGSNGPFPYLYRNWLLPSTMLAPGTRSAGPPTTCPSDWPGTARSGRSSTNSSATCCCSGSQSPASSVVAWPPWSRPRRMVALDVRASRSPRELDHLFNGFRHQLLLNVIRFTAVFLVGSRPLSVPGQGARLGLARPVATSALFIVGMLLAQRRAPRRPEPDVRLHRFDAPRAAHRLPDALAGHPSPLPAGGRPRTTTPTGSTSTGTRCRSCWRSGARSASASPST